MLFEEINIQPAKFPDDAKLKPIRFKLEGFPGSDSEYGPQSEPESEPELEPESEPKFEESVVQKATLKRLKKLIINNIQYRYA